VQLFKAIVVGAFPVMNNLSNCMKHSPSRQALFNTIFQVICQYIDKLHIYYRPHYDNRNESPSFTSQCLPAIISTGVKRPERKADLSCSTIAETKT